MSQNFASAAFVRSLRSAPALQPIKLCEPLPGNPGALSFQADWAVYGIDFGLAGNSNIIPNVALRIEAEAGAGGSIGTVKGVFIDNTECGSPVYLVSQDTGHIVLCPDYATVQMPVITGGSSFKLVCANIRIPYANKQSTRVILTNVPLQPSQTPEFNLVQPTSRLSGLGIFSTPVVADKLLNYDYTLPFGSGLQKSVTPLVPPKNNSYNVISQMVIYKRRILSSAEGTIILSFINANDESTIARVLFACGTTGTQGSSNQYTTELLLSLTNLQLTLDGAKGISLLVDYSGTNRTDVTSFSASAYLAYATIDTPALT